MGVTGAILGGALGNAVLSAIQNHQQAKEAKAIKEEEKQTVLREKQALAEQSPELAADAGKSDAVKKRKTSFGLQESVVNNWMASSGNTVGQKETWG